MSVYPLARLGDLGEIITGTTPTTSVSTYYGGSIPFVTPSDLDSDYPIAESKTYLTEAGVKTARLLPPESILVSCIGSLGKVGITGASLVTNQQINALVPKRNILEPRYALHACRLLKPTMEATAPSTTMKIVNKTRFSDLQIPLPAIAAQRRIAAILDQAEALRAKRRQALAKLDTLTQSLFVNLCERGKSPHHALKEIVNFRTGKLDSNAAKADGVYPFFTCAKEDACIDVYAFDQEALLLAGNNAAGEYSVKHYKGKFNAYQRTYVIGVDESLCTYEYMQFALQSKLSDLKFQSKGTGTKYLTLEILHRLKIPVPGIQSQRHFTERIKWIDLQRTSALRADSELRRLQSSLEHRAFRGEL